MQVRRRESNPLRRWLLNDSLQVLRQKIPRIERPSPLLLVAVDIRKQGTPSTCMGPLAFPSFIRHPRQLTQRIRIRVYADVSGEFVESDPNLLHWASMSFSAFVNAAWIA